MTEVIAPWVPMWRLDRFTLNPQQVNVLPVSHDFVLVEGEDHTQYRGGFFDSPEAAFASYADEIDRSRRHDEDRQQRLDRARERYEKGAAS